MTIKLSKREKTMLYILFCLILVAGGMSFLILPGLSRTMEAKSEADSLEMQLQEMQVINDSYGSKLDSYNDLTESTNDLYVDYFLNTATDEEMDVFITKTALDAGVAPQNLTINAPDFLPITSYSATSGEDQTNQDQADANTETQFGSIVTNLVVSGECSYEDFIKLVAAFENQTQLHINSASFQNSTDAQQSPTFSIGLDVYTLPPHNTGVSYYEEQ